MKVNEQILGKYKIVEVLGSGSFSTVYRADEGDDRTCCRNQGPR